MNDILDNILYLYYNNQEEDLFQSSDICDKHKLA